MGKRKISELNRTWYENNKDKHNQRRREAYKNNSAMREAAVSRSQAYRDSNDVNLVGGAVIRLVGGKNTKVFTTGYVARVVGKTQQTLRVWQKKGLIPEPTVSTGKHRFYTGKQIKLIASLVDFLDSRVGAKKDTKSNLDVLVEKIHTKW